MKSQKIETITLDATDLSEILKEKFGEDIEIFIDCYNKSIASSPYYDDGHTIPAFKNIVIKKIF